MFVCVLYPFVVFVCLFVHACKQETRLELFKLPIAFPRQLEGKNTLLFYFYQISIRTGLISDCDDIHFPILIFRNKRTDGKIDLLR